MKVGDILIPQCSVSGCGADRFLSGAKLSQNDSFGKAFHPNKESFQKMYEIAQEKTRKSGFNVFTTKTFSADTVLGEYAHLDEILALGCDSIEMETATFFCAAEITGKRAVALLYVADNTIAGKSLYKGRTKEDKERKEKVKQTIIPTVLINYFNSFP
ncbi:hypothetical protein AGMMS49949_08340 [Alphaproteobacteria bacterium]|nr:hypothetical protein AGMMS49949_08340 [Alphaproteobacteria bacterium]GHS99471.1 hypothetical protein AGMMS50296_7620 [Alphaproteobacteria bacterium]